MEQAALRHPGAADRSIVAWLLTGCLLIFAMVIVGGITRLTGSGLSITEWKLVHGVIPPLSTAQWEQEFDNYRQIPQYRNLNYGFTLEDFKGIYWWEYIHRLLGRIIGFVFLVPFLWFLSTGKLSRSLVIKLLFLFVLGAVQGFLGWYMVRSGLVNNLYVSHIRLAIHLLAAFITFGFTFLVALGIVFPDPVNNASDITFFRKFGAAFLALLLVQLVYGAFVAGLKAGYIYNTFPLMGDTVLPDAVSAGWSQQGAGALAGNKAVVQFIHRGLAWLLLLGAMALFTLTRRQNSGGRLSRMQRMSAYGVVAATGVQFLLGVFTLCLHVPVVVGVVHQAGAFLLFGCTVFWMHGLYRKMPENQDTH